MSPVGAAIALLDLLLPGYAWIVASGLSKRLGPLEELVLSFMLSVSSMSFLTAAFSIFTPNYMLYATIILSVVPVLYLTGRFLRKPVLIRGILRHSVPSTTTCILAMTVVLYGCVILALYWSAPFYPPAYGVDPVFHVNETAEIIAGVGKSVLQANVPVGLHFASAVIATLAQITPLESLRVLLSLVLLMIVPLTYISARQLFEDQKKAIATVLVGAFVIPVDAFHFIEVGTFPNVLEDAIILSIVWLLFAYVAKPNRAIGATLGFLGFAGMFTHASFLLFFGVVWILLGLMILQFRDRARRYLQACTYSTIGVLVLGVLLWPLLLGNIKRVLSSYLLIKDIVPAIFVDYTSNVSYNLIHNFVLLSGPIAAAAIGLAVILVIVKQRNAVGPVFAVGWLVILIIAAFLSGFTDRFVLFSLIPGTFLIGNLIASAFEVIKAESRISIRGIRVKQIFALILVLMTITGGFPSLMSGAFDPLARQRQHAVVESMRWLQENNCSSGVASVGLFPDYGYLNVLTGLTYVGDLYGNSTTVLQMSSSSGFSCVVVAIDSPFVQSFATDAQFQERYRNRLVAIFIRLSSTPYHSFAVRHPFA